MDSSENHMISGADMQVKRSRVYRPAKDFAGAGVDRIGCLGSNSRWSDLSEENYCRRYQKRKKPQLSIWMGRPSFVRARERGRP